MGTIEDAPIGRAFAGSLQVSEKETFDMKMNGSIAYCGLNCAACEARMAAVNNDDALREKGRNVRQLRGGHDM